MIDPVYLVRARERLARAEAEWAKYECTDRPDPGAFSGTRRKPNARAENAMHNKWMRESAAAVELEAARAAVAGAERRAEREAHNRKTQAAITPEALASATHARVIYGWYPITRINTKTITVAGDFGPLRVPIKQVLETRKVAEAE